MFVVRNYVTMCGTIACALGIGYLMQYGTAAQPSDAQNQIAAATQTNQTSVLAGLDSIVLTSASATASDTDDAVVAPKTTRIEPRQKPAQKSCNLSARAVAVPGAQARLTIKSPCRGNERISIHHSGLTLTQVTDQNGTLRVTIPALSEYAIFLISFPDQTGTVATTHVPDLKDYDRVALQWKGDKALQIHALEFGASYGGEGHVWSNSATAGAGSVVSLGHSGLTDAQNIEVYSFPAGQSQQSGTIDLTVEAEVTENNCGHTLNVQSIELRANTGLRSRDLSVAVPDCSQLGEFLVLNNLLQDLTIAAK